MNIFCVLDKERELSFIELFIFKNIIGFYREIEMCARLIYTLHTNTLRQISPNAFVCMYVSEQDGVIGNVS